MSNLRNRSTRSLWDPNYTDASWVNSKVQLIPRLRNWVNANYPGLQIGITEYNWGAEGFINGATTQADILGIFGREGLDMATRWTTPDASTPTYKAIKMYRNYDGSKSTFGDTSVSDVVPDPDNLSSFAAVRSSDGALTVMIINKNLSSAALANVNISNFSSAGQAQVWQLTSANSITRLSDVSVSSNVNLNVPAQSITLLVIAQAAPTPTPTPTPTPSPSPTPTASPSPPVIFTEEASQRALALDSVNLLRDPFVGNTTLNFSGDHRTDLFYWPETSICWWVKPLRSSPLRLTTDSEDLSLDCGVGEQSARTKLADPGDAQVSRSMDDRWRCVGYAEAPWCS